MGKKIELVEGFASGSRKQLANRLLSNYAYDGKGIAVYSDSILICDSGNINAKYAKGS